MVEVKQLPTSCSHNSLSFPLGRGIYNQRTYQKPQIKDSHELVMLYTLL